jgi:hypothetical protein
MCQIYALRHPYFQYLIPLRSRLIYYVQIEFAGVAGKLLEFMELKLNAKRRILHFKCPRDFPVRDELMDPTIKVN